MSKKQTLQERTSALEFEVKMLEDTIKVLELKNKELTKQLRLGVVGVTFKEKEATDIESIDTIFLDKKTNKEMVLMSKRIVTINQYRRFIKDLEESQL